MTNQQTAAVVIIGAAGAYLLLKRPAAIFGPSEDDGVLTPSVTTSEGYDLEPYGGPTTYPQPIIRFAQAIAKQEGFYLAGSIPNRANNPGDLKLPGQATLAGTSITVFESVDQGWTALYRQLWLILKGGSSYYNLDMSIDEMSRVWTATQQGPWAANVSSYLGVAPSTPLWQVLT